MNMIVVTVKGIPKNLNEGRFSMFLKRIILRNKRSQFLVTKSIIDNECNIEFKSNKDAETVHKTLQGFEYMHKNNTYLLQCYINNNQSLIKGDAFTNYEVENLDRVRDRSPIKEKVSTNDLTQMNIAIEITKKKRILLEEERKLLLEKKKMELLKSSTPTNIDELQHVENVCNSSSLTIIEKMLAQKKKKQARNQSQIGGSFKVRQRIFSEISKVFYSNVTSEESYVLRKIVHSSIRDRIESLLKDNVGLMNSEVYSKYRSKYPKSDDEAYILDLIKDGRKQIVNGDSKISDKPQSDSQKDATRSTNRFDVTVVPPLRPPRTLLPAGAQALPGMRSHVKSENPPVTHQPISQVPDSNTSANRSIHVLSELQEDLDMDDLDDWVEDDIMTKDNMKEVSSDVQMVPQEKI